MSSLLQTLWYRAVPITLILSLGSAFLQRRHIFFISHIPGTSFFLEETARALYLSDIFFLLLFVTALFCGYIRRLFPWPILWLLSLFLLVACIRNFFVPNVQEGVYAVARTAQWFLLVLLLWNLFRHPSLRRLALWCILIVACVEGVFGIAQVLHGRSFGMSIIGEPVLSLMLPGVAKIDTPFGKVLRAYGTLPHPNVLAGLLLLGIGATAILFSDEEQEKIKKWLLLAFTILFLSLVATGSRSAFLSLFLSGIFLVFKKQKGKRGSFFKAMRRILLLFAVLTIIPFSRSLLVSRIVPPETDLAFYDRFISYSNFWRVWQEKPFTGSGMGHYVTTLKELVPLGTTLQNWEYDVPHSTPLFFMAENGLVSLPFLAYGFFFLLPWVKAKKRTEAAFLVFLFLIPFIVDHYLWSLQPGRILLALLLSLVATAPNEQRFT